MPRVWIETSKDCSMTSSSRKIIYGHEVDPKLVQSTLFPCSPSSLFFVMVSQSNSDKNRRTKVKEAITGDKHHTPGVQKIKSSLRQTQRLLAKESLAADIRIETTRRLKSLEGDLARAEQSRKERQYATKYHKTRIERQKVCRKIKRVKKELGNTSTSPTELAELKDSLISLRVDLNYILHYPKLQKYISLFPSDTSDSSETDARRNELRQQIKIAMEKGELDAEPELKMDKGNETELFFQGGKSQSARSSTVKSGSLTTDAFFETSGDEGH